MTDADSMREAPWPDALTPEPRQPGSRRPLLVVLLAVSGGVIVLGACGGVVLAAVLHWSAASGPSIVGEWDMLQPAIGARVTFEFRPNKTGVIKAQGAEWEFDYALSRDDPAMLEWRITSMGGGARHAFKQPGKVAVAPQANIKLDVNGAVLIDAVTERFRVTFDNNGLLTLTNDNRPLPFKLRRLR
jgi:hypothetical protein